MKVGRITISDRASAGIYEDRSGPEIERCLREGLQGPLDFIASIVPDDQELIAAKLIEYADREHCDLVVTTGGTGITLRDVTPEATRSVLERELPGFGEVMRLHSFERVRTSILSRAVAGTRGRSLIVNLPGKPKAIAECLALLADAIQEGVCHLQGRNPHSPEPT